MQCAACSAAVERVTKRLDGVTESSVNLPLNRLTITYDKTKCSEKDIIDAVSKAGFKAELHSEKKHEESDEKNKYEKIRLTISLVLAGILLFISMGSMASLFHITNPLNFALLEMLLCIPVMALGYKLFYNGFKSLFLGNPNMDSLVALSASASFIYSLVHIILMSSDDHLVHNLYFESAAVVVALVSLGKFLENRSNEKTKESIRALTNLAPKTAVLCDSNGEHDVPADSIKVSDTVLVKPGQNVPLDGIIISGSGEVNESMLTGESMPVLKNPGDSLTGGSISLNGAFYMKVTKIGADTVLAKIIKFVEDAQGKKAPISKIADKVSGIFVPAVIIIAVLSAVIWLLCGQSLAFAVKIFTCVLVIACPCAMGLATPTAVIVGTGMGASNGILIRSGEALETAHNVNTVIFDKTGTLTNGKPVVCNVITDDEKQMLLYAYSLEKMSDHPISQAVNDYSKLKSIEPKSVTDFKNVSGKGLSGVVEDKNILIGNSAFMKENNIKTEKYENDAAEFQNSGKTVIFVSAESRIEGIIAVSDTVRESAADAVRRLKEMNIKTVMLTGDNRASAGYIAAKVGIDEIQPEVLPTEKAEIVKKYQDADNIVMMVGDGINDAPALTQADVGCAVGNGSDIAIDSAGIVLMRDDLNAVCQAVELSRMTIKCIKQNLFWAFCYNVIGIPIAAGALYPATGMLLSPMIGGLAMSLSSLFVVTNALRLKTKKLN